MVTDINAVIEILPQLGLCFGGVFAVIIIVWLGIAGMTKLFKK